VDRSCIGVKQKFGWVVPLAAAAIIGSADPEPVGLSRRDTGDEAMPDVAITLRQHKLGFGAVTVEETQRDLFTVG
jgi:hypothetical protein